MSGQVAPPPRLAPKDSFCLGKWQLSGSLDSMSLAS